MIICFAIWRILAEQTFLTEIVGHRPITSGLRKVSLVLERPMGFGLLIATEYSGDRDRGP